MKVKLTTNAADHPPELRTVAVTNLNDSGPGSLRAAIGLEGPWLIVLETQGMDGCLELTSPIVKG